MGWIRELFEDTDSPAMDRNLVSLMARFCENEVSVRLTRPLSLGTARDMHHLHIRQIQVLSAETNGKPGQVCELRFVDASPCVKRGDVDGAADGKPRTPLRCIDGDMSFASYNHN